MKKLFSVLLSASWHRWIANHAPAGRVSSVTISDDTITYSR